MITVSSSAKSALACRRANWPLTSAGSWARWICSSLAPLTLIVSSIGAPCGVRRAASRITLDVVSVRAERLQDITDEEIAAEGVTMQALIDLGVPSFPWPAAPLDLWRLGWNAINGKRAPWEANPWVWRVEFRRCP